MFQYITIASKIRANTGLAATVLMDTSATVNGSTLEKTAKVSVNTASFMVVTSIL